MRRIARREWMLGASAAARFAELAKLFREDIPATFLYPDLYTSVASARIRGLENSPYRGDLTWCMDQLWLEGEA